MQINKFFILFLTGLMLGIKVFSIKLSTALQGKTLSAADAQSLAAICIDLLKSLRSEEKFKTFVEEVNSAKDSLG